MSLDDFGTPNISHTKKAGSVSDQYSKKQKRQLILETVTTGFCPEQGDRIIEIGIIELIDRKLTGNSFHIYLNPERPVGSSLYIHGLSDLFLSDRPFFADIVDGLETFLIGAEVIAIDARFDIRFLDAEMQRSGREPVTGRIEVIDVVDIVKLKFSGKNIPIDVLAKQCNVKQRAPTSCSALLDAETLTEVYLKLTNVTTTEKCKCCEISAQYQEQQDPDIDQVLYEIVKEYVIQTQNADVSSIQDKYFLGYERSAKIVDALEDNRIVSPIDASGKRHVLIKWQP